MAKCTALGMGLIIEAGACPADKTMLELRVLGMALADAELNAGRTCPKGRRCIGTARVVTPPTLRTVTITVGGRRVRSCVAVATATYDGECKADRDVPEPRPAARRPIKEITARNLSEFFAKVMQLPKLPRRTPTSECQMYRTKIGRGGYEVPICAGACDGGKTCKTTVTVDARGRITASCSCG